MYGVNKIIVMLNFEEKNNCFKKSVYLLYCCLYYEMMKDIF